MILTEGEMNQESENFIVEDERKLPIYIDSELDDYGLDPYTFRIYARLARRAGRTGQAFESVASMAKCCKMSERQVQYSLKELFGNRMIRRSQRTGTTTVYTLTSPSAWVPVSQHADPIDTPTPAPDAPPPPHLMHPTPAPDAPKGIPMKVLPSKVVVAETPITPEPPRPPSPTTTAAVAAPKGEKPAASAKPSAREVESTACEILHNFVRRNNPHWSPTIRDQETINAKVPASELPAFSDFVSNWFLDYPNTRHASKILTAYAEQSAKRKLETERASQGANDLKELARRIEHSRQQDIKLANERRANRGNDQPVASGTARPASEPPPARRPYCLPESFVGTVWATPDARRDAVRMVEDQEGDELPDCFRPMGVRAQPVYTTVNA